jgi:hypothetical protein
MPLSDSRSGRHPLDGFGGRSLAVAGLPRLPAPPSHVPCPIPRRIERRHDRSPTRAAFPVFQAGRHPHQPFRGLLGLHSHYGPSDRSTAQGDLCHEAPAQRVPPPNRSSATRAIDYFPGGTFLPLVVRAFGAHWKSLASEPQISENPWYYIPIYLEGFGEGREVQKRHHYSEIMGLSNDVTVSSRSTRIV